MNKFEQGSGFSKETNDIKGGLGEVGKEQPVITVNELVYNAEQLSENSSKMIVRDLSNQAQQTDPSGEAIEQKEILMADARRQNHVGLSTSLAGKAIVAFAALSYISSACKTPVQAEFSTETPPISRVSEGVPIASEEAEEADGIQETARAKMEETREGKEADETSAFEPVALPQEEVKEIPEVDLGWHDWMIFKDFFGGTDQPITEEFMKEHFDPMDHEGPIYMFIARHSYMYNDKMTYPYKTATPEYDPGFDYVEIINGEKMGMSLELNEIEKEILEKFIIFRQHKGSNLRLFLYIGDKKEGQEIREFLEQEGAFVLIEDADPKLSEDGKNFKVTIKEDEEIPWEIIPYEFWDDIAEGNAMLDLREGRGNCFADVDDIKGGVTPR